MCPPPEDESTSKDNSENGSPNILAEALASGTVQTTTKSVPEDALIKSTADHVPKAVPRNSGSRNLKLIAAVLTLCTIGLLASTIVLATRKDRSTTIMAASSRTSSFISTDDDSNPCSGKNPGAPNVACLNDDIMEQAGANVTKGYNGDLNTSAVPITVPYYQVGLCPVNVHWHLGAEHYSAGEFDENGKGPSSPAKRRLADGSVRLGYQCGFYDEADAKFTKPFDWKHCVDMEVGQTYEVHWPHSAAGACGTVHQYQTPFLDGVFCMDDVLTVTHEQIGVQSQTFTIVNDEDYYYPDLMRGMIVDEGTEFGTNLAMYTGSTTGTSRNNEICSQYTPITWQVDRKCHMISASTFDKMCADMKAVADDMSEDLYAHGSRELVDDSLAANNHANLRKKA